MGGIGPFFKTLSAEYLPAYLATTAALHVKVTTAVNTAQRLGTLNPTPQILDERFTLQNRQQPAYRPPWHLIIQNPIGNSNPVYVTWDNNTTPVVGGPGFEIAPGGALWIEQAEELLTPSGGGATYPVNALSAIQIISLTAQPLLLTYSD